MRKRTGKEGDNFKCAICDHVVGTQPGIYLHLQGIHGKPMVQGETYERTYEEVTPAKRGRKPKVVVERDGNGRAKITEAVEARVRELSDNLRTAKYIADKLGIGQTTVKDILRRTEHVPV